ncbi:hypothetical protein KY362_01655 [Candidatus Woesearchaeota archaeon]|nr:hypothetical protein [Candidatus Woesearchaeota archaeon]
MVGRDGSGNDDRSDTLFYAGISFGELPSGAGVKMSDRRQSQASQSPADTLDGIDLVRVYRTDVAVPGLDEMEGSPIVTDVSNMVLNFYCWSPDRSFLHVRGYYLFPHRESPDASFMNFSRMSEADICSDELVPGSRVFCAKVAPYDHEQIGAFANFAIVSSLSYCPRAVFDAAARDFVARAEGYVSNVRRVRDAVEAQVAALRRKGEQQIAAMPRPGIAEVFSTLLVCEEED